MQTVELPNLEKLKQDYNALTTRPCETAQELRQLTLDWNNTTKTYYHAYKRFNIAYNCNTKDETAKKNHQFCAAEMMPIISKAEFEIGKRIASHPKFEEVQPEFPIYFRNLKLNLTLFREENIPLFVEHEELCSQHDELMGGLMVDFQGQRLPYQAISKYLESVNRDERKEAFLAREKAILSITDDLDKLFSKLLKGRHQIALNAGFKNYRDYMFQSKRRFDYTPKDCFDFHDAIEKLIVPMMIDLNQEKLAKLGIDRARPWDRHANSDSNSDAPFDTAQELLDGCGEIFKKMDAELYSYYQDMVAKKTLDLDVREGKTGGGFCSDLPLDKTSFIFMNASGSRMDVETMLHESGHAFHNYLASANVPLYGNQHSGAEFAEVASMSMELLARPYLEQFYSKEALPEILKSQLVRAIKLFPFIAMIDGFQQWVYTSGTNGGYVDDPKAWRQKWLELEKRFVPYIDWKGHERYQETGWQYLHVFQYPFYYVEYGIAQIGAFNVWANSLKDPKHALSLYKKALKLGGTKPLPELFETIGAKFGLDEKTLKPVLDTVKEQLQS